MTLVGTKSGSLQTLINSGGITGNTTLSVTGSSNPTFGVTAPAALIGTIGTNAAGSCTLVLSDVGQTVTSAVKVAVFWSVGGVLNAAYDLTVASNSFATPTNTVTIHQATGAPDVGTFKFWAASGALPTTLPANGTLISVAIAQDITDGVSIPAGTGQYIQQLMATSTQIGLVVWEKTANGVEDRLSAITVAGGFDTWPTTAAQAGATPTGGAVSSNNATGAWIASDTVTVIRCYNLGSTVALVGVSSSSATVQAGVILA